MQNVTEIIERETFTAEEISADPLAVAEETEIAPVYDFQTEVQSDWRAEKRLLWAEILVIFTIIAIIVVRYFVLLRFK